MFPYKYNLIGLYSSNHCKFYVPVWSEHRVSGIKLKSNTRSLCLSIDAIQCSIFALQCIGKGDFETELIKCSSNYYSNLYLISFKQIVNWLCSLFTVFSAQCSGVTNFKFNLNISLNFGSFRFKVIQWTENVANIFSSCLIFGLANDSRSNWISHSIKSLKDVRCEHAFTQKYARPK